MPLQKSEYACPTCRDTLGQNNQIYGNMGELICSVNSAHKWNDLDAFLALKPQMVFRVTPPAPLPQQNHEPYTVSLPIAVARAVKEKYGDKAGPTLASILMQMVEGEVMLVGETDLERLSDGERGLGKRPANSSEMCGMIFALREETREAKMIAETAAKELKAYEGMHVGSVVINLGEQYAKAQGKAQDQGLPVKVWAERMMNTALESDWF